MNTKTEYIKFDASDVSKVQAPKLTKTERRLLARSGLPGTELYNNNSGTNAKQARIQLTMAVSGFSLRG